MKQLIFLLAVFSLTTFSFVPAQNSDETEAIKSAAMDYVEGWYQGDAERMAKSLHSDLVKRTVREISNTGQPFLNHISKTTLVEYTRAGGGKDTPKDKLFHEVDVLDVYKEIATVKGVSAIMSTICIWQSGMGSG